MALPSNVANPSTHEVPQQVAPDQFESVGTANRLRNHLASPSNEFLEIFWRSVEDTVGPVAGQIWGLERTGRLSKVSSTEPGRFQIFEHPSVVKRHQELISSALFGKQAVTSPFRETENPARESELWLAPYFFEAEPIGVVELIFTDSVSAEQRKDVIKLIAVLSDYFSEQAPLTSPNPPETTPAQTYQPPNPAVQRRSPPVSATVPTPPVLSIDELSGQSNKPAAIKVPQTSSPAPRESSMLDLDDLASFALLLHNQPELEYVASTAVNETRRMLDVDRVSLGIQRGDQTQIVAISGQDRLSARSNVVKAMQRLAQQAIVTGQPIHFDHSTAGESAELSDAVAQFISETKASSIHAVPLFEPERIQLDSDVHTADQVVFAALLIEQFSDRRHPVSSNANRLASHISLATYHALQQEQIFMLPLRRSMGRGAEKLKIGRTKSIVLVALILIAGLMFTFVKVPYRVPATGRLMPAQQFRAYSPQDGEVQAVLVTSGQAVQATQPLLQLHNEQLTTRRLVLTNSLTEKSKLLSAYKAQLDDNTSSKSASEKIGFSAKVAQTSLEIDGLRQQLNSVENQLHRMTVQTEINGTVATFQPADLLAGRPVNRGELLLEIMNESGPWQLELTLSEKRLGHLLNQPAEHRSSAAITFVQATMPGQTFHGQLFEIAPRASQEENGESTILLRAAIAENQPLRRTIGAEVTAKIDCGKKSLGYVCFGDLLDWFQSKVW